MAWSEPKTNWHCETVNGVYTGDRFNAVDFNRIKNNLAYLQNLAARLYNDFTVNPLGSDKTFSDYFYADEINKMEETLSAINEKTFKRDYGTARIYVDNGKTMTFDELNRLESACLDLYNRLTNQSERSRRTLKFNFGIKEMF